MLQISLWKRIAIIATCIVGLWLAMPNFFYTTVEQHNDAVKEREKFEEKIKESVTRRGWKKTRTEKKRKEKED